MADDGVCYLFTSAATVAITRLPSSATAVPEPVLRGLPDVVLQAMHDGTD